MGKPLRSSGWSSTVRALNRGTCQVTFPAAPNTKECEVLVDSWRTPMTTVRIAHVEPRPERLPDGGFQTRGFLVVLADDAGRRAVPIWLREPDAAALPLEDFVLPLRTDLRRPEACERNWTVRRQTQ
jgi:hypothetical protein